MPKTENSQPGTKSKKCPKKREGVKKSIKQNFGSDTKILPLQKGAKVPKLAITGTFEFHGGKITVRKQGIREDG